jgi:AcrR family transcriptional regulator
MAAMIAMLSIHGYDGASFEKVAAAAGVSRPSIYRRWTGKELLVVDAVRAMLSEDMADFENSRAESGLDKIRRLMEIVARRLADPVKSNIIITIVSAANSHEELAVLLGDLEFQRRTPLVDAVRQAQAAGELSQSLDPDLVAEALLGTVYFRRLFSLHKPDGRTIQQVVDGILGIAPEN